MKRQGIATSLDVIAIKSLIPFFRMLRAFNQPVGIMSGKVERYSVDIVNDAEKEVYYLYIAT